MGDGGRPKTKTGAISRPFLFRNNLIENVQAFAFPFAL